MTIITELQVDSNQKTCYATDSYQESLAKGEAYEDAVVALLRANGLNADRYRQDLSCLRKQRKFKLFPRFQRDAFILMPWGRLNIEIKARSGKPFEWGTVHVGRQEGWDVKAFQVHYLIIVCQETGKIKFTTSDKISRSQRWIRTTSKDECYSVPNGYFRPIENLIKALYSGYIPTSHHAYEKFGHKFDGLILPYGGSTDVRLEP